MAIKKLLVVGCSFTKGTGLEGENKNKQLWINQLHKQCWPEYTLTNLSECGRNNEWIFHETMSKLSKEYYDLVLVAWTAIPRINLNIGFELYSTMTMFNDKSIDVNINNGVTISGRFLKKLGNDLRKLHHDHWDILDLIKYINVLTEIQSHRQGKILFVNALCPWSDDFFEKKKLSTPSDMSVYEQEFFSISNRDDEEIFKLYEKMHEQYSYYGGIHEELWLNLYESLHHLQIDMASDTDQHPGLLSQDIFVEKLKQKLNKELNVHTNPRKRRIRNERNTR